MLIVGNNFLAVVNGISKDIGCLQIGESKMDFLGLNFADSNAKRIMKVVF